MAITKVSAALANLDGEVVINESSADADFRVESNGNTHMLFVDGGTNSVGIGGTPTNAGVSGAASPVLAIIGTVPELNFVDTSDSANDYWIRVSDGLQFGEASDSRMYLKNGGDLGIGTTSHNVHSGTGLVLHATSGGTGNTGSPRLRFTNTTTGQAATDGAELSLDGNTSNFYIENRESEAIIFYSGSERGRWRNGGGLCFNGDTAAANALDDYEEGTWTPQIKGYTGTNVSIGTVSDAVYTRVGRLVYISAYLLNIDIASMTDGTYVVIHNLPFASDADNYAPVVFGYNNTNIVGGYVENNGIVFLNNSSGNEFQQQNNDITPTNGTARFMIGITMSLNV